MFTWDFLFQPVFLGGVHMELLKQPDWQHWIWHLFTSHWVVYSESSFTNVGNDLRIYLTLVVTNCRRERPFCKLKIVERTKKHH